MAIPVTEAEIAAVFANKAKFSLGCMFSQIVVDTFFAGVLTMQVMTYIKYQRNDSWWTKGIVIVAVTINLGITVYLWWFDQYLFVENFGLWSPFAETKYLAPFPFLDSLNSGACQAFFTYRAWRLMNRNWVIPVVCGALILTSIGATLSVWIIFSSYESLFQAAGVSIPENLWLASIMSADIIITVSILTGLLRSKTGWSHTDRTITKLIRMTLESQVPPTFIAIAFMVEYGIEPSSLFGSTLQGIQPKFYVLGLMYTLNQRVNFRAQWATDSEEPAPMFAMSGRPTQKTIQVEMETETYVQSETVAPHQRGLNRTNSALDEEKPKDLEAGSDVHTEVSFGSKTRLAK